MTDEWLTGYAPVEWREGYTHLIRAPGDPDERLARGHGRARQRRWGEAGPSRKISKMDSEQIVEELLSALGEEELTFNAISVRAFDLTADVAFGTKINALLWDLVDEGALEHTRRAPVRFRKRV
ncbi:MAG: hypothetical protein K0U16_07340 [Gammaproteobacteria bacterium]|nr:hypothetical protein [Gammaproteobacteria bacterium]